MRRGAQILLWNPSSILVQGFLSVCMVSQLVLPLRSCLLTCNDDHWPKPPTLVAAARPCFPHPNSLAVTKGVGKLGFALSDHSIRGSLLIWCLRWPSVSYLLEHMRGLKGTRPAAVAKKSANLTRRSASGQPAFSASDIVANLEQISPLPSIRSSHLEKQ